MRNVFLGNIKGFTLIETVIYAAIVAIVLTSFVSFGISISASRAKAYVVQEAQANARMLIETVTQNIRQAKSVIAPLAGQSTESLVLDIQNSNSEVTFLSIDGVVYLREGEGVIQAITSDEVEVTNLQFLNVSAVGDIDSILVEFDMEFRDAGSPEYSYSDSFRFVTTLRY